MAVKEWRVVSVNRKGLFKVFGENEQLARDFVTPREVERMIKGKTVKVMQRGGSLAGDEEGEYRLESRPSGMTGNDLTWKEESL